MGTWSITTPVSIASRSGNQYAEVPFNTFDDNSLITGILADGALGQALGMGAITLTNVAASGTMRFNFDQNSKIIRLDGGAAISFNSLPAGFIVTSATLSFLVGAAIAPLYYLQLGVGTEGPALIPNFPFSLNAGSISYNFSTTHSMLEIINNGFGFRVAFINDNDFFQISNFSFTGNYSIASFSWSLPNSTTPIKRLVTGKTRITSLGTGYGVPIVPTVAGTTDTRTIITLTSPTSGSPTPLNFTKISAINLVFADNITNPLQVANVSIPIASTDIIAQTANLFTFYIPQSFYDILIIIFFRWFKINPRPKSIEIPIHIYGTGDGTQFSGSIDLGTLIVLVIDGSGIYKIVKDKTNDTIYSSDVDGTRFATTYSVNNSFELDDEEFDFSIINPNLLTTAGLPDDDDEIFNEITLINFYTITSVAKTTDIKIPDPFVKTAFIGG